MSVKVRIELRDDEGIFSKQPLSKEDLSTLVMQALHDASSGNVLGPFIDGEALVFEITVSEHRTQWRASKRAEQTSSTDQD